MDDIEKIEHWMRERGITQLRLAEMLGKSHITINKILNRKIPLTAATRAFIFKLMGEKEPAQPLAYRIDLNDEQEALIRRAAELAHKHVDEFVEEILDLFFGSADEVPQDLQAAEDEEGKP